MDRRDYTDRVLSSLRRVTEKEQEAIRSELDGHIEDHMEALRELGYDEELAEERAIAAMGEPDEVGRELNKQYTGWGWVLVSRAADSSLFHLGLATPASTVVQIFLCGIWYLRRSHRLNRLGLIRK